MDTNIIITISGYVFSVVTGVASWLAGIRSRRNSVYQELLATIQMLSKMNRELQEEMSEVRKENAELKAGQAEMSRKMEELKAENKELKVLVTKNK